MAMAVSTSGITAMTGYYPPASDWSRSVDIPRPWIIGSQLSINDLQTMGVGFPYEIPMIPMEKIAMESPMKSHEITRVHGEIP